MYNTLAAEAPNNGQQTPLLPSKNTQSEHPSGHTDLESTNNGGAQMQRDVCVCEWRSTHSTLAYIVAGVEWMPTLLPQRFSGKKVEKCLSAEIALASYKHGRVATCNLSGSKT
eukprot:6479252-Amphidinium_carterae.3